jgi:hypothetical protein
MSNNNTPVSEYIKQAVFLLLIASLVLFGIKSCRTFQKKRQVVIELDSHINESAAYEQFYTETAHENLIQAMYQMHLATELGMTPLEILNKVNEREKEMFETQKEKNIPIREALIRDALLSNYDNCLKLGIFDDPTNLTELSYGELPTITKGPAKGQFAVIHHIISSSILPGADKLLPNMIIGPPAENDSHAIGTQFDKARAKLLAQALNRANLIETSDLKKVTDYYDKLAKQKGPLKTRKI